MILVIMKTISFQSYKLRIRQLQLQAQKKYVIVLKLEMPLIRNLMTMTREVSELPVDQRRVFQNTLFLLSQHCLNDCT